MGWNLTGEDRIPLTHATLELKKRCQVRKKGTATPKKSEVYRDKKRERCGGKGDQQNAGDGKKRLSDSRGGRQTGIKRMS